MPTKPWLDVLRAFRANVGEYPPIIAAGIQRIIRDEADPDAELERLATRNDFDINRLNADWGEPNVPLNPRVTIEDLEIPLRQPELMPPGWTVKSAGGKHWDVTNPAGHRVRVTHRRGSIPTSRWPVCNGGQVPKRDLGPDHSTDAAGRYRRQGS